MRRLFKVGSDRHDNGKVTFSWHPEGNFLASAGRNGIVHITDRHGDIIDEVPLSSSAPVLDLAWDKEGENLAVLQEDSGVVPLWSLQSKRVVPLETNLKDPTFLAWSKTGPQLAVGTAKGSLLIYNKSRKQKTPIVGKHSKKITCGSWSKSGNKLVLGADDRTLTVSNENGDTLIQTDLKYAPWQAYFTSSGGSYREENIVSANLNGKSLLLYNLLDEKDEPIELTFAQKENGNGCRYGDLIDHCWYQENLVLIGFSGGYLLSVSTSSKELGEEKFCARIHSESLTIFAYNPQLNKVASAGNDGVRIIDVRDFKEIKADYISLADLEDGRINSLAWSPDGQILSVGTAAGNVYNFLAKMSAIFATYKTSIGYLSSLREVSIVDAVKRGRPIDVMVKLEPSIIAIGADHVAAGMNNRVYYHRISDGDSGHPVNEQEYIGVVKDVQLNKEFAVVLTDSKALLHPIESSPKSQSLSRTFPNREEGSYSKVTCIALTDSFLFYGTEAGTVEIFFLSEWTLLSGIELRLDNPIKKIYPNNNGTRLVVIDGANQSFLYNPVSGSAGNNGVTQFEAAPTNIVNVMWDLEEKNVIAFFDGKSMHTFIYIPTSIKGTLLVKLGPVTVSSIGEVSLKADKVDIASGNTPLICINGALTCQTSGSTLSTLVHPFFNQLEAPPPSNNKSSRGRGGDEDRARIEILSNNFCQALALHKLERAWEAALQLDKRSFYFALSHKAMELLNVEMAFRVYSQLGDAGMVMALKDCMNIEDKSLLAGQIALLFGDYQRAQDLFLASSRPITALEMRRDLMQWEQALKLAHVLAASQIPDICIHYGQQLEVRDEKDAAFKMFDDALHAMDDEGNRVIPDHLVPIAMMGKARCYIRLGNTRPGIQMANELDDSQLFIDCGVILEAQKQYQEAASMYVKGQQYEKAAQIYTQYLIKNDRARISEAAAILEKVKNDSLNSSFGRACLAAGRFEDALRAFRRASDWDEVVKLQLKNLDQIQQAFDLVRRTASAQAAQIVAEYCQEQSDWRGAIEFLLIANKSEDAFKLAQANNIVETYTAFLGDAISPEDALKVAHYYEKSQDFGKAGRFYATCGQYSRALRLFLQCGDKEIDMAIDVVGKSQNEGLAHQLIDFLVGEKDGMPKDPNYLYRLSLALKKYEDAAKTALVIARQEQDLGNYSNAHGVICEIIRFLEDAGIKVSLQVRQAFVMLHSYTLIKQLVRRNDHLGAARLLLRVAQNVSRFPTHVVQLLTSTVIECQRAGLKASSYEYAAMLVRPEYRPHIDPNLKRKIEAIVRRKYAHGDEIPEETSPCPISGDMIPVTQLECPTTRDALPMCIITGRHMVLDDWCFCPVSKFPALYSEYVKYIREERVDQTGIDGVAAQASGGDNLLDSTTAKDPILGKSVSVRELSLATKEEAMKYIQRYNNVVEKKVAAADSDAAGNAAAEGEKGSTKTDIDDEGGSPSKSNSSKGKSSKISKAKMDRINRTKKRKAEGK